MSPEIDSGPFYIKLEDLPQNNQARIVSASLQVESSRVWHPKEGLWQGNQSIRIIYQTDTLFVDRRTRRGVDVIVLLDGVTPGFITRLNYGVIVENLGILG